MTMEINRLPVRLGRDGNGSPVVIDLIAGAHMLICGETRSGKSVLSYLLLGEIAGYFEQVRVVGIDPTSVLLGPFRDRFRDPGLVLGTEDGPRMTALLDACVLEMEKRLRMLRDVGFSDKLSRFGASLPLYVIVLEELPGIVRALEAHDKSSGAKPADRLAPRAKLAIERLVSESAKVGFRVISLAQRPDAEVLGGYARAQMPTRIALRMGSAEDFRMTLSDITPAQAAEGIASPPGVAFLRTPGDGVRRFRVDHVAGYELYVDRVRSTAPRLGVQAPEPAIAWTNENDEAVDV